MRKKLINRTKIIAEAGVNHQGKLQIAKQMINAAAKANCDYIKFQVFSADKLSTETAEKAEYQKIQHLKNENQFKMLKRLELSHDELIELKEFSDRKKIKFLCSGFDKEDLKNIKKIGLDILKIPSGEIDNVNYLQFAAKNFKKIILSTGMATIKEIEFAIKILIKNGIKKKRLTLLHCRSSYPTKIEEMNLNSIAFLKKKFKCNVGLSDHSMGMQAAIISTVLGVSLIEKHFTLNKFLKGPDHQSSINPKELINLVKKIRETEKILGFYEKRPTKDELKNKKFVRKMIVAKKKIIKGDMFTEKNISCKRPMSGIPSSKWEKVINKISKQNFNVNQPIKV